MSPLAWQKSSFSGEAANCLNVAAAADRMVRLRESDEPDVILRASATALRGLLIAIKDGRLTGSLSE
jgi:hypothetical protein